MHQPLKWAKALAPLLGICALIATAGAFGSRLNTAEREIVELKAITFTSGKEWTDADQSHELRLQRIEDKLEVMQLTLTEIWEQVKLNANGRRPAR